MNLKGAFEKFGVVQKNVRWSWSGISNDRKTVVLTLWRDQYHFCKEEKIYYWSTFGQENEIWINDLGNKERIENIQFCIDNCNRRFRAISVYPKEDHREIERAVPMTQLIWTIDEFDFSSGECSGHSFPEPCPFIKS